MKLFDNFKELQFFVLLFHNKILPSHLTGILAYQQRQKLVLALEKREINFFQTFSSSYFWWY